VQRDLIAAQAEMNDRPLELQQEIGAIDRGTAELDQQSTETETRRELVVAAPQDGIVTAIQTEKGATANTTVPLLTLVPKDSRLVAHLYGTSRAVGFVQVGQRVSLRYQAYPYQRFGRHE